MLWSGMIGLNYRLSKEGKKRFFSEFLPLLHDTKHEVLGKEDDVNSWYLVYIGTKTASRGKGYAKALIEHTTKQVSWLRPNPVIESHVTLICLLVLKDMRQNFPASSKVRRIFPPTVLTVRPRRTKKTAPATSNAATRSISNSTAVSASPLPGKSSSSAARSPSSWIS